MLACRYHADLRVYAISVNSLLRTIGGNFADALKRADRARMVFEKARDQLNKHIRDHNCQK